MSDNLLKSVCWDITSTCNDNCSFCYRNIGIDDLSLEQNKRILKKLIDFGVDKISFVGGEPLLYHSIVELMQWGKEYSESRTKFSITTNGILFTKMCNGTLQIDEVYLETIMNLIDWITFSLDAPNMYAQTKMGRNAYHFERIIMLLEHISNRYIDKRIKINTIVSKVNYEYINDIYNLLIKYNVERWKLFRFLPSRGNASLHKEMYYITESEYNDIIYRLDQVNTEKKVKITINGYDKFDNSYITISSNGHLIIYENGKYMDKVDVLNEPIEKILNEIHIEKHVLNRSDFKTV